MNCTPGIDLIDNTIASCRGDFAQCNSIRSCTIELVESPNWHFCTIMRFSSMEDATLNHRPNQKVQQSRDLGPGTPGSLVFGLPKVEPWEQVSKRNLSWAVEIAEAL